MHRGHSQLDTCRIALRPYLSVFARIQSPIYLASYADIRDEPKEYLRRRLRSIRLSDF